MRDQLSALRCKEFYLPVCPFINLQLYQARAATNKKPILISQATNTRAVAFESFTMKAEPFPLTAYRPAYGTDTRTRICIFAMDLELLPGEGANAFSSDVQDATGKIYPLRVEFVGQVPNFPGITMISCQARRRSGRRRRRLAATEPARNVE